MEIKTKKHFNEIIKSLTEELLDEEDLEMITKLIKNVVGDILRDIWLKRNAWK